MEGTFSPAWGKTTSTPNAISATAALILPRCEEIAIANTSATATVYVMVTPYMDASTVPTGVAPTTSTGFPILPLSQVRLNVGAGHKVIRMIASAADGNTIITPGDGV